MTDTATPAKATILFVDDERNVLQGIRRSTRSMRDRWDIHVADGGAAALEVLADLPRIDVVVSDMRMPGMDGAELLNRVREQYPTTARIILSGQADRESIFRAIGPAHQYLAKPCDTEELIDIIDRIWAAGDGLMGEPASRLVGQVDGLPSPPEILTRLDSVMATDDWSMGDLAAVLGDDPAMTATILKLINSAFFGFRKRVESVEQAISLLGIDTVRGVVLGQLLYQDTDFLGEGLDLEAVGERSRSVAAVVRTLVQRDGGSKTETADAYIAGMVNEVGLLVLGRYEELDDQMLAILASPQPDRPIEWQVFGADRFRVGAYLLNLWGFAPETVAAVAGLAEDPAEAEGLTWYLNAARQLVCVQGVDAEDIVAERVEDLDERLAALGGRGRSAAATE